MECMRDKIKNIVDFKRYIESHNFKEYIIEVNQKMKLSFQRAKVYLSPDLLYLGSGNGIFICFDVESIIEEDNYFIIYINYNNIKYKSILYCYQYN